MKEINGVKGVDWAPWMAGSTSCVRWDFPISEWVASTAARQVYLCGDICLEMFGDRSLFGRDSLFYFYLSTGFVGSRSVCLQRGDVDTSWKRKETLQQLRVEVEVSDGTA